MFDAIEAVRADQAALLEIGRSLPRDRTAPVRTSTTARPGFRFSVPRGLIAGTLVVIVLVWGQYVVGLGTSLLSAQVQTGLFLGLLLLTACSRRAKVLLVRTVQRYAINPLFRLLLAAGINPLGLAILETRGHASGKTRRVPVGNGRKGEDFWIIAEHGTRAGYVRNIQYNPHVRVRLRTGLRYRWVPGIATVCPGDDPLARQRHIIAWHPLRALNAMYVRVLGADLLTVQSTSTSPRPRAPAGPPGPRRPSRGHQQIASAPRAAI